MVKITFKRLQEINAVVGELYKKQKELENTKFGYAWNKFAEKNYTKHLKEFQSEIHTVRIDNALEDKNTKEVLRDPTTLRGYKYSKDGEKNVVKQENEIVDKWEVKEIEVEPYLIKKENLPILNEYQTEVLKGILIE